MRISLISFLLVAPVWAAPSDLEMARDRQDRAALEKLAEQAGAAEQKADNDAAARFAERLKVDDLFYEWTMPIT